MVHPICIPEEPHDDPDKRESQTVDVIGYADSELTLNNNLKETEMQIYSRKLCDEKVMEAGKKGKLKLAKNLMSRSTKSFYLQVEDTRMFRPQ